VKNLRQFLACLAAFGFLTVPATSGPKQPFSLAIAQPKQPVRAGTELRLRITVTNTNDKPISFITSPGPIPDDGLRYEVNVTDEQGHQAPASAYLRTRDSRIPTNYGSSFARTLRPGESFVDEVTVTAFYDLSRPGEYRIWVARRMPPRQALGTGRVRSNVVNVMIVP
jgi:hypothetical protein